MSSFNSLQIKDELSKINNKLEIIIEHLNISNSDTISQKKKKNSLSNKKKEQKINKIGNVKIYKNTDTYTIDGDTYNIKHLLKKHDAIWSNDSKNWTVKTSQFELLHTLLLKYCQTVDIIDNSHLASLQDYDESNINNSHSKQIPVFDFLDEDD